MGYLNKIAFSAFLVALYPSGTESSIFTISDDRIRSLDITPVLGRGYSIMTNAFHSTCLVVEETTTPSYNYDYFFTDFTSSTDKESELSGKTSGSFSFTGISVAASASASSTSKVTTNTRTIAATMRIERYYSSVREEITELSTDAVQLLTDQDYVGFFKACGPNYVRGIRRAQEVTATFQFQSSSKETARQFGSAMKVSTWRAGGGASATGKSKFKSASSSLTINIVGYGLGLTQEGSETMVATTLAEYTNVMKFAFRAMTQLEDSYSVGMVYGMEVVPWVHNVGFQNAAKLADENILIPMPRNLIPRAYAKDKSDTLYTTATRDEFKCKGFNFKIDKFGYCCEIEQLYALNGTGYRDLATHVPATDVCRPIQVLDKSLVKDNMSNNGEYVARLGSALRYKFVQMGVLEKCISASNSIPDKFLDHVLKSQDAVKYPNVIKVDVTLRHLKLALDPRGDYKFIKHIGKELDEWIEMFYSPCMAALFGANVGTTPDVEVSYFMAYPWYHHKECMYLTCLTTNMRWDRDEGGCVPGQLTGFAGANYTMVDGADAKCAKDSDENDGDEEVCKYDQQELMDYQKEVKECWKENPIGNVDYFITYYCLPQITAEKQESSDEQDSLTAIYNGCRKVPSTSSDDFTIRRRQLSLDESSSDNDEFSAKLKRRMKGIKNVKKDKSPDEDNFADDLKMRIDSSRVGFESNFVME